MQINHPGEKPITVVQITDCHLGEHPHGELLGMDTDHSLQHVVALVKDERPNPDLLLCTGDLSNNGCLDAYHRFQDSIKDFACPALWLMGNHDFYENMAQAIQNGSELNRAVLIGSWQIIMLNSSIPHKVEGTLADSELQFLQSCLEQHPQRNHLVCLHHHVLPIGCAWLDAQRIGNADQFLALCCRFSSIRAVLSGHVHQLFEQDYQGFKMLTSPSSCVQFATQSDDFKVDTLNPGYRWFELHPDGRLETGVSRVTGVEFKVDFSSQGY